ncbi:hypothetical protein OC845_003462 [Tilletia horrida]|nr:hypothetical protein OC845_003462 [Tilletia horrida]
MLHRQGLEDGYPDLLPSPSNSYAHGHEVGRLWATSSASKLTFLPLILTSTPVVKATVTVQRPRTSTVVTSSTFTNYVNGGTDFVSRTVTPTSFVVTVVTKTSTLPTVTQTLTDILITPSPGTFTSTSTFFTAAPAPTIPPPAVTRRALRDLEPETALEERECSADEELELERRAGQSVGAGNANAAVARLRGRNVFCRRIVRLDPKTVKASRTSTVTVRTTAHPRVTSTSTLVITSTRTIYSSAVGVIVTAAPKTSTISASITVTSTPTASVTVKTTSTVFGPQPTLVVPQLRNVYCGPLARTFTSDTIGIFDGTQQQLTSPTVPAGSTCCDAAANIPGAIGYADFSGICFAGVLTANPLSDTCVAGNPATSLIFNIGCTNLSPGAQCPVAGQLQCASYT